MKTISYFLQAFLILCLNLCYILTYKNVFANSTTVFPMSPTAATQTTTTPSPTLDKRQKKFLERLNKYRRNLNPQSSNMQYLEYSLTLEKDVKEALARICSKAKQNKIRTKYGETLVANSTMATPESVMEVWYKEKSFYDYETLSCEADKNCNNYLQIVWAKAGEFGCSYCIFMQRYWWLCYFSSPAIPGKTPYKVGDPCTRCDIGNGGKCLDDLCVTKQFCNRNETKDQCECKLYCHFANKINDETCTCECEHGFQTLDCASDDDGAISGLQNSLSSGRLLVVLSLFIVILSNLLKNTLY